MSNPELVVGLTVLVTIAVHYQSGLGYREYRFLHIGKCYVFYLLNSWASKRGRPLVRTIGEDSYVMTVDESPRSVFETITETQEERTTVDPFQKPVTFIREALRYYFSRPTRYFIPHLIATAKRNENGSWSHSQLVQFHDDTRQTECVLFLNSDGSTSVYGHLETSVTDPEGHVSNEQTKGDPLGAIQNLLE